MITGLCTRDGACLPLCPVECIVTGPEGNPEWGMAYWIDPDTCIECGACAPECPVDAIFASEEEVPAEYEEWIGLNWAFFEEGPGYSVA